MSRKTKAERNAYAKAWRDANAEKVRAQARARYAANPGAIREKARLRSIAWYASNRDSVLADSRVRRAANPERSRQQTREWRVANPDKVRDLHLKKYGITGAEWDTMFASQNRSCAACQSADPRSKRGWHTDHDHDTGKVRGILCHPCNTVLGLLGDSVERVNETAISLCRYLGGVSFNPDSNSRFDDDLLFYV